MVVEPGISQVRTSKPHSVYGGPCVEELRGASVAIDSGYGQHSVLKLHYSTCRNDNTYPN